VYLEVLEYKSK